MTRNYTGVKDLFKYDAGNGYPCFDVLHECSVGNVTQHHHDVQACHPCNSHSCLCSLPGQFWTTRQTRRLCSQPYRRRWTGLRPRHLRRSWTILLLEAEATGEIRCCSHCSRCSRCSSCSCSSEADCDCTKAASCCSASCVQRLPSSSCSPAVHPACSCSCPAVLPACSCSSASSCSKLLARTGRSLPDQPWPEIICLHC